MKNSSLKPIIWLASNLSENQDPILRSDLQAMLAAVFRQTGIGFVADNLHSTWQSPRPDSPASTRAQEIARWHKLHPEVNDQWVILDDEISGTGREANTFIVWCKGSQGITQAVYERLRSAFRSRLLREDGQ